MDRQPEISDENKIMMMLVRIGDENVEKIDLHIEKICTHLSKQFIRFEEFITNLFIK